MGMNTFVLLVAVLMVSVRAGLNDEESLEQSIAQILSLQKPVHRASRSLQDFDAEELRLKLCELILNDGIHYHQTTDNGPDEDLTGFGFEEDWSDMDYLEPINQVYGRDEGCFTGTFDLTGNLSEDDFFEDYAPPLRVPLVDDLDQTPAGPAYTHNHFSFPIICFVGLVIKPSLTCSSTIHLHILKPDM